MKIFKDLKFSKGINFIDKILEKLIDKLNNDFSATYILIIIDNIFLEKTDEEVLNKIIIKIKNQEKYKLILCGEGHFFFDKIKKYYTNELGVGVHRAEDLLQFNSDNTLIEQINQKKSKEKHLEEEQTYLNKLEIKDLIHSEFLDGKEMNMTQFQKLYFINVLPNYFRIYFNEKTYNIKLSIENEIFLTALKKHTDFYIIQNQIDTVMNRKLFPRNVFGISEELLIILLLKNNKFELKNLVFEEKFIIQIKEINGIKNGMTGNFWKKIEYGENVLIIQEKYNGPKYDLAIIQSLQSHRIAIFIQVGLDKNLSEIKSQYFNLKNNRNNYIRNLEQYFMCKIDGISLFYIFDEDTQKEKGPNQISGSKICDRYGINYLLYSFKDKSLKSYDPKQNTYYSINYSYFICDKFIDDTNIFEIYDDEFNELDYF